MKSFLRSATRNTYVEEILTRLYDLGCGLNWEYTRDNQISRHPKHFVKLTFLTPDTHTYQCKPKKC